MSLRHLLLICAGLVVASGALPDVAAPATPAAELFRAVVIVALLKPWLESHLQ